MADSCGREGAIATFIVDWPVLIFIGLVFGTFAPARAWLRSRPFLAGLAGALVFTAVALVSYAIAPDWMWMYFVDPHALAWLVWLIPPAYLLTYVLGFAAAIGLRSLSRACVWVAALLALIAEVVVVAATWDRYHLVGTAQQWASGRAHELVTTAPSGDARTIGMLGPVFAIALAAALWVAWRTREAPADR